MKKIILIFVYLLLAVLLFINAFTFSIKNNILKTPVINRLVDNTGIYETVYQKFETEGRRRAVLVMQDNNLSPELGDWMWNNISEVFDREYVENFTRINMEAIISYVLGESDELATFNLLPKYAQLMDVTAKNLDADVITQVLNIENDNTKKAINILDSVIKSDAVKKQVVESIFESTDSIKTPFIITTTEQMLGFVGQEKQLENIIDARLKVQKYNRYVSGLIVSIILLCMVIVILNMNEIGKCLNDFWVTFAVAGTIVLVAGLAIGYFEINVIELINENLLDIGLQNKQSAISGVLYTLAYSSMKVGLLYVIIGVIFLISIYVYNKISKKRLEQ